MVLDQSVIRFLLGIERPMGTTMWQRHKRSDVPESFVGNREAHPKILLR